MATIKNFSSNESAVIQTGLYGSAGQVQFMVEDPETDEELFRGYTYAADDEEITIDVTDIVRSMLDPAEMEPKTSTNNGLSIHKSAVWLAIHYGTTSAMSTTVYVCVKQYDYLPGLTLSAHQSGQTTFPINGHVCNQQYIFLGM